MSFLKVSRRKATFTGNRKKNPEIEEERNTKGDEPPFLGGKRLIDRNEGKKSRSQ